MDIPENIDNLMNLEELKLSNNQLTYLPESIVNLSILEVLTLHSNELTFITQNICNLTNLNWSQYEDYWGYSDIIDNNLCPPYPDCLVNQEPYDDLNENSIWDEGEPFEDTNENG